MKRRAGGDYPQSWVRDYGNGRVFYMSMGHATTSGPVQAHITDGIRWALGMEK